MVLFSTKRGEFAKAMNGIGNSRKGSEFGVYFQILAWLFLPDQASSSVTPLPKKDRKRLELTGFRYGERLQEGRMATKMRRRKRRSNDFNPLWNFSTIPDGLSAVPRSNGDVLLLLADGSEPHFDVVGVVVGSCLETPPGYPKCVSRQPIRTCVWL